MLMNNKVDPDHLASSEVSWYESRLFWKWYEKFNKNKHTVHLLENYDISTQQRMWTDSNQPGNQPSQIRFSLCTQWGSKVKCLQILVCHWFFLNFWTKTYVVGAQKNCFNEAVFLSTQNMFKLKGRKIITI